METAEERVTAPAQATDDKVLDYTLRPRTLLEFVGQREIKENLEILMGAAKKRKEPIEHVLLYGNPGLGKTTLAHIIAAEMGSAIRTTAGPTIERVGDLAAILTNLTPGDVLFIDEIHRLSKSVEEVLYSAMEEYALDLVVGKGPAARTLRLDLPRFTLIGATTRISLLSSPLRDRFGATYHLTFYTQEDIEKILARSARLLNVKADTEALTEIAKRSRRTPRVANRLLRRVRDFAQVRGGVTPPTSPYPKGRESEKVPPLKVRGGQGELCEITRTLALEALGYLNVDPHGLDEVDRHLLSTIIEKFNGGPVGLNTLAAATAEEEATIEEIYEPYLLQLGFLDRTSRGRVATSRAYEHLGVKKPGVLI
ncbi:Holliday junction DNA helicase RuvB [Candidatus Uhrbacteria bacterium RIFCSPLOWO2_01_FULL_47_24]|uniref:Holliday junction branch migration complex subunit RuvB n=1 Tax=Candidatus Uhrbacteria bacterium RIFCSPLOWO2_01_FULL_47_24 TaxID=1802401 RepID=A0A1F7UV08_9BACT|nr:MAG: Holliday junction DNA helicase RuvB [Candidatus Uhrbacteria bacterium RIFCSPHIGHO2_02_FULL_46_47]OGL82099.1 MAG: Holliday junction DNA helicase RuvB [Candidatus Uhrbacteria bacterium RIFCSPLOWO2_01_FULL_47_24]OGL85494.1 MAG: Holliday junction DNA helicase RuvB [Candidatus Uhrbacteria bacterium RIFCSPLOWO2_02_FULL_46_25]OGL93320.1 MAG: Holliday junction DNA helicase RuvB [Candidatus Uhrbacteria bacterium RIFCSPLOWO2_12_FULL_47_10]